MTIVLQIVLGVVLGIVLAKLTLYLLTKTSLISEGLDMIFMIAMVLRGDETIIPDGNTMIQENDIVVLYQ